MNNTQKDQNTDAQDMPEQDEYLARVESATEETVRQRRVIDLDFSVIRGPMPFSIHSRFVFTKNWNPKRASYSGLQLGKFMHGLQQRLNNDADAPEQQKVSAEVLLGSVGTVDPQYRIGCDEPKGGDFQGIRLAPKIELRQERILHGSDVDAALVNAVKPHVGACPLCLREVAPGDVMCPTCGFNQRSFWRTHCPKCLFVAYDTELHCSICGAPLSETADAKAAATRSVS